MNGYDLERLVMKTYKFVENTVFRSENYNKTIVEIILAMYKANNIKFERDYFSENILEILNDIEGRGAWKLHDDSYNTKQVFIY